MENKLLSNPTTAERYKLMQTPQEQKTFLIMEGVKANHAPVEHYLELITMVYAYKGHKIDATEKANQAKLFKAEVATFYKNISFEEVRIAIETALRADTDRLEYPSIESYSLAIKRYLNDAKTLNDKKAVLQRLNPNDIPELSPEEKEAISQSGFERLKAKVLAGESIVNDMGTLGCYLWLKKKGVLKGIMTEEEREQTKQRAIQLMQAEFMATANTLNKDVRRAALKKSQDLIAGLLPNELNATCQKLALEYLIRNGKV